MIRAVLDTNVLVSGLIRPAGNEALIITATHHGVVLPCFSAEILDEYAAVLIRPKFAFPAADVSALIAMLKRNGEMFAPASADITSPDPSDAKFIDCALAAQAEFLITGNKRHFPQRTYGSTRVVGAGELLDRIAAEI